MWSLAATVTSSHRSIVCITDRISWIPVAPLAQHLQRPVDLRRRHRPQIIAATSRPVLVVQRLPVLQRKFRRPLDRLQPRSAQHSLRFRSRHPQSHASEFRSCFRGAAKPARTSSRNASGSSTSTAGPVTHVQPHYG